MKILDDELIQLEIRESIANIQIKDGIENYDATSALLAVNEVILTLRADGDVFAVNININSSDFCKDSSVENTQTSRLSTYVFSRLLGFGRVVAINIHRPLSNIELQLALNCDYRLWNPISEFDTLHQNILLNGLQQLRYRGYLLEIELHDYKISDLLKSGFYQIGKGEDWLKQFVPPQAAGMATGYAKLAITQGHSLPLAGALLLERHLQEQLFAGKDSREGMRAYLEKRPSHFVGA